MNHDGKSRDELTREANEVRSKLMRTVEQLDRRRHEAMDLTVQLKRHVRQVAAVGAVFLLATAAAVAIVVQRVASAAQRRRRDRWILARSMWRNPERALRAERRRSFFADLLRSALLSLANAAVTLPARRVIGLLLGEGGERAKVAR